MAITKQDALAYHRMGRPGKIEVTPTKPLVTQRDLSLAYSPGVAEAVLEVAEHPLTAYELTAKGNLVAVVSNGTAILGLGDRGALASKPVMEGKGVLFKRFADIDVFDIEINASTAEEIIAAVRAIAPTFGGINLEDIAAPICFEVEEQLKAELDIPVFHDDQHGTAIISGAALLNALEVTGKQLQDIKVVVNGAGASAIATSKFYVSLGVRRENIVMCDSKGVVYEGRAGVNKYKAEFAIPDDGRRTLADAVTGADVFLGLSVAGALKPEMVATMAENPLIFALANPTPEIMPEEALAVRPDAIVGTGRSDYANQINNVLGFPFIFRGALDVAAREINEPMKLAAAHALAALAHEDVPDSVLSAYGLNALRFGRDYLIPKPLDPRVLLWVTPAVAQAGIESGVARRELNIDTYREELIRRQGLGKQLRHDIINKVRAGTPVRIALAEGEQSRVLRAAAEIEEQGIGSVILLGDPQRIQAQIAELGLQIEPEIVNPLTDPRCVHYAEVLFQQRQRKGVTHAQAEQLLNNPNYFGPMMVMMGDADTCLSGLTFEYPEVIRPALQVVGTAPNAQLASGVYLMIIKGNVYLFTDATVNIEPDAEALSEIAIHAADFAQMLGITPRVAMLSFSNFGSSPHPLSLKVKYATQLVRDKRPDLAVDGEMQADTAVMEELVDARYPFSRVKNANVLVFPELNAANIAVKLLQRLSGAEVIGPIVLGMGQPIHVLHSTHDVQEIVSVAAVAAMDAQARRSNGMGVSDEAQLAAHAGD